MGKIAIVTDSNSGITQAQAEELGVYVIPLLLSVTMAILPILSLLLVCYLTVQRINASAPDGLIL